MNILSAVHSSLLFTLLCCSLLRDPYLLCPTLCCSLLYCPPLRDPYLFYPTLCYFQNCCDNTIYKIGNVSTPITIGDSYYLTSDVFTGCTTAILSTLFNISGLFITASEYTDCDDCFINESIICPTPTPTPTNTSTQTPTQTPTQTNTETPTQTPTNTDTPTQTPTNTETPTNTPTPTNLS